MEFLSIWFPTSDYLNCSLTAIDGFFVILTANDGFLWFLTAIDGFLQF